MKNTQALFGAIAFLGLSVASGYVGTRFPIDQWYADLAKPAWNPPNWIFGPVWSVLYLMIALSGWLLWRDRGITGAALPLLIFVVQLGLNAAWSWIFFGRHQIGLALIEIIVLWVVILINIIAFWRLKPASGILLLPYLAWVSFAAVLNFTIWRLNA